MHHTAKYCTTSTLLHTQNCISFGICRKEDKSYTADTGFFAVMSANFTSPFWKPRSIHSVAIAPLIVVSPVRNILKKLRGTRARNAGRRCGRDGWSKGVV